MRKLFRSILVAAFAVVAIGFHYLAPVSAVHAATDQPGLTEPSIAGSFLAGRQAFREFRTAAAAHYFLDAAQASWDDPVLVDRAFAALSANGQIDDAAAVARHLLTIDPTHDMAKVLLGTVALRERRYDAVITELESVAPEGFMGISAAIIRAWAYVGQGDYEKSQRELDSIGRGGFEDFLLFHRGLMADVAGEREAALDYFKQAYDLDKFAGRTVEGYARMLGNQGQNAEAMQVMDDFYSEGLDFAPLGVVRDAVQAGKRPGKLVGDPQAGAAEFFQRFGVALTRERSADIAIVFLRLGAYLDPRSDVIPISIAELLESAGQHDLANDVYRGIPSESPMHPTVEVRIAANFDAMGDRPEAIRQLERIVSDEPDNLDAVSTLGDYLRYDEQFAKSADVYTAALKLIGGDRPRDWRFYYVRGISYERSDQWDKAEADFQHALKLNPKQPQVLNYLGYSWVDKGLHLKEALAMIREAVDANPGDGYIVDSLGWAFYRLKQYDEAASILERAVKLLPNDPEVNDHLGDVYWRLGRKLEAKFQWTVANDMDKEGGRVRERVVPKLADGLGSQDG